MKVIYNANKGTLNNKEIETEILKKGIMNRSYIKDFQKCFIRSIIIKANNVSRDFGVEENKYFYLKYNNKYYKRKYFINEETIGQYKFLISKKNNYIILNDFLEEVNKKEFIKLKTGNQEVREFEDLTIEIKR